MIRWGILSTGTIAKKFAETLNEMKGEAIFCGVASRDIKKAQAFADEYGAEKAFGSYKDMAESEQIDAIYIATPNSLHFENAMLCLENGKHVLCEKPFTTSSTDAEKLYAFAQSKKLLIMDGLWTMHLPMYAKIRQIIGDGDIGEVVHIRAEYGFAPQGERREFKLNQALGGGSLLDVGIYNVGFVAMILGINPSLIKAHLNIGSYHTDELATAVLVYPNKATATITSAIGAVLPQEAVIFGTKGRIILPNYQSATLAILQPNEGEPLRYGQPFNINGFEYQIREFSRCVSEGLTESRLTPEFSIGVIKILEEIRNCSEVQ